MAFDFLAPAVRALRGAWSLAAACVSWTLAVTVVLLAARDARTVMAVAVGGLLVILLMPAWRRRWRTVLMVSVAFVSFLVLGEVAIRLSYFGVESLRTPGRFQPIGAMDDPAYLVPAPEPGVVYTLRPQFNGWVKGVQVQANRLGLRDKDWSVQRQPGTIRIMSLGTSIAMGEGVLFNLTYTSRLGQQLQSDGLPVEMLNFGVGGYTLGAAQALLRARGLAYTPDIVIQELSVATLGETALAQTHLQAAFVETMQHPPMASFFETNSFAVFAIYPPKSFRAKLSSLRSRAGATGAGVPDGFVPRTVEAFGRLAAERQFLGVVFVPHPISGFGPAPLHAAERASIRTMVEHAGLLYVDSYDQFTAADTVEALSIFPAELHPNAEANRRHADALIAALGPRVRGLHSAAGVR